MRRPLWRVLQTHVEAWRRMGASAYLCRNIQFGIYEQPLHPFVTGGGTELGDIPQTTEDLEFGTEDIRKGLESGIYHEVTPEHAQKARKAGAVISSAFVVWQEREGERAGRFVVNLSVQSKHWGKGSVRMETLGEFAMSVQPGDHMLSMDIQKGFRHLRLHPAMRDWFIFRYAGRYFHCVALPFGWGRSPLWFTRLMAPFVAEIRSYGYRVLPYMDDFLIIPSRYGVVAGVGHCRRARKRIQALMATLGLRRHPEKGEWEGATVVDHLGVRVDTVKMRFTVLPYKATQVRKLASDLLKQVRLGRRMVNVNALRSFCGTCVSLSLALPWARFYTRSLYWDMSNKKTKDTRGRCRLSHQSVRDLRFWKRLAGPELEGRNIIPTSPDAALHSDAADVGYGGTLNDKDLTAGVSGLWSDQGVWNWRDRAEAITHRELKAIRMLLQGPLGTEVKKRGLHELLLHVDNQPVVHIANSFVSSSRPLMQELRRLKRVLQHLNVHVRAEWLPSAVNRFADALSRRFPRGDLLIRRQLRRSVAAGMKAPVDAFKYRPLGEHPFVLRKIMLEELEQPWDDGTVRVLCPPVDLIMPTVNKLARTKASAVLLIPDWRRQAWHQAALQLCQRWRPLPEAPAEVWEAQRRLNPAWRLLELEINL